MALLLTAVAAIGLIAPLSIASPAAAAPPQLPTLVAPADGAVSTAPDPRLSVSVSDPEGDPLSVAFEGRRKGSTVPAGTAAEPFTLVVIPDIQNYTTAARAPIIAQQSRWIVDNRTALNTQFVVQVGDLVNDWNSPGQWSFASNGLRALDENGVPNAVVAGNHDFDNTTGAHGAYDSWFPPSRYQNAAWTPTTARYGGYMGQNQFGPDSEDRANMNNYSLFTAGGVDWLVLGLEWEAPASVLAWADRVLAAHPDRQVIVFTHAFLDLSAARRTLPQRPGGTPPEMTWQNFVRSHCQVRLVVNGHEHEGTLGESRRVDDNACGRPVHQILSDYQDRPNGGDGWLRYYRFDPAAATMTASTFSPYLNRFESDDDSSFTLPFPLGATVPAPFTPIETVPASSGSIVSTTWTGLSRGADYEWRVRVSDANDTTVSPTWTVRTPPDGVLARDLFERSTVNGWGTADTGGAWNLGAPTDRFAVAGGAGVMTLANSGWVQASLAGVSSSSSRLVASFSVDKIAHAQYINFIGRQVGGEQYLLRVRVAGDGTLQLLVMRGSNAVGSSYSVPGLVIVPGMVLTVAFEVKGGSPTTLSGKIWKASDPEPSAWQVTRSDATAALQGPGTVGISSYVPSAANAYPVKVSVTELTLTDPDTGPVAPPVNQPPMASFATSVNGLGLSVDGAGSSDPDGSVVSYSWDWGDGTPLASGVTASHTYEVAGLYSVRLTVTDDKGLSTTATRPVNVTVAASGVLASDDFNRTVPNAWGVADQGGAWTLRGTASRFSVAAGTGAISVPSASTLYADLNSVSSTSTRVDAVFTVDKLIEAQYVAVVGRRVGSTNYIARLRMQADGGVRLYLLQDAATAVAPMLQVPLTITVGEKYVLAIEVTGTSPTTVKGKVWKQSDVEPAWQRQGTNSLAALQTAGAVSVFSYLPTSALAPSVVSFDRITVIDPSAGPAVNQVPSAGFSSDVTNLVASLDGSSSSDPDGSVVSYAWTFGDGSSATTASATTTHAYAAAGMYIVTLRVSDDDGGVSTPVSKSVTVTAPPQPGVLARDLFERSTVNGWGTADTGGAWTATTPVSRYAVAGGAGVMTLANSGWVQASLAGVSSSSSRLVASFSVDKIAHAQYINFIGRQVGGEQYLLRVRVAGDGTLQLLVMRGSNAVGSSYSVPGLVIVPGMVLTVAFEVKGGSPTTLSGKIWKASDPEPSAWQVTRSDATAALQGPGTVGISSYVPSAANAYPVKVSVTELTVTTPAP